MELHGIIICIETEWHCILHLSLNFTRVRGSAVLSWAGGGGGGGVGVKDLVDPDLAVFAENKM